MAGSTHRAGVGAVSTAEPSSSNPLTRLRRRSRLLDTALAVHERVGAVGGNPLSSAIALAGFLSLFPLLLVGVAVMGFFSAGNVDFADEVAEDLGLEGDIADTLVDTIHSAERSRQAATAIGLIGLAWSGLAVANALQATLNAVWQVKGKGVKSRLWAVVWLGGLGLLFLASIGLAPLVSILPGPAIVGSMLVGFVIDILIFLSMFRVLTNVRVPWRAHLPGAVLAAVGFGVLKAISGLYVPRLVESSSLWGSLGVVFVLLAWFLLISRLVVYSAALNVVVYERRHGTVTVELEAPRMDGVVALAATRGGAVSETVAAGDGA